MRPLLRYVIEVLPLPFTSFFLLLATVVLTAPAQEVWSGTVPQPRPPSLPACLELPARMVPGCLSLWG